MGRNLASTAVVAAVASSLLICGCALPPAPSASASGLARESGSPGTGSGAAYTPMVDMTGVDSAVLALDVAACRTEAANVRMIRLKSQDSDVTDLVMFGVGMVVPFGLVGMALVSGLMGDDGKPRPATDALQQKTLVSCMARKGYRNTDPQVTVAYAVRPDAGSRAAVLAPRTGRDTYVAESFAKSSDFCRGTPARALLESKGPGFERHSVECGDGRRLALRCEFGNCVPEAMEVAWGH